MLVLTTPFIFHGAKPNAFSTSSRAASETKRQNFLYTHQVKSMHHHASKFHSSKSHFVESVSSEDSDDVTVRAHALAGRRCPFTQHTTHSPIHTSGSHRGTIPLLSGRCEVIRSTIVLQKTTRFFKKSFKMLVAMSVLTNLPLVLSHQQGRIGEAIVPDDPNA